MKLPPTLTYIVLPLIFSIGCHNQAAGGFFGDFCTANSKYAPSGFPPRASSGVDVMVKPPALGMSGTKVSSHWPAKNFTAYDCVREVGGIGDMARSVEIHLDSIDLIANV